MSLARLLSGVHVSTKEFIPNAAKNISTFDDFVQHTACYIALQKLSSIDAVPIDAVEPSPVDPSFSLIYSACNVSLVLQGGFVREDFFDIVRHEDQWYALLLSQDIVVRNMGGVRQYVRRLEQKSETLRKAIGETPSIVQFAPFQENGANVRGWLVKEAESSSIPVEWVDLGYQVKALNKRYYDRSSR